MVDSFSICRREENELNVQSEKFPRKYLNPVDPCGLREVHSPAVVEWAWVETRIPVTIPSAVVEKGL